MFETATVYTTAKIPKETESGKYRENKNKRKNLENRMDQSNKRKRIDERMFHNVGSVVDKCPERS